MFWILFVCNICIIIAFSVGLLTATSRNYYGIKCSDVSVLQRCWSAASIYHVWVKGAAQMCMMCLDVCVFVIVWAFEAAEWASTSVGIQVFSNLKMLNVLPRSSCPSPRDLCTGWVWPLPFLETQKLQQCFGAKLLFALWWPLRHQGLVFSLGCPRIPRPRLVSMLVLRRSLAFAQLGSVTSVSSLRGLAGFTAAQTTLNWSTVWLFKCQDDFLKQEQTRASKQPKVLGCFRILLQYLYYCPKKFDWLDFFDCLSPKG